MLLCGFEHVTSVRGGEVELLDEVGVTESEGVAEGRGQIYWWSGTDWVITWWTKTSSSEPSNVMKPNPGRRQGVR